jgi:hypothetical protein
MPEPPAPERYFEKAPGIFVSIRIYGMSRMEGF